MLTRQLGHLQEAHIIRHGTHKHRCLVLLVPHVPRHAREGEGRAVGLGHIQTLQHNLSEGAVRPPRQEPEELYEQSKVDVVRHRGRTDLVAHTAATRHQINTHAAERKGSHDDGGCPRRREASKPRKGIGATHEDGTPISSLHILSPLC